MSRLTIPPRDDTAPASREILDAVFRKLGFVPGLHRALAISPPALEAFTSLQDAVSHTLDEKTRTRIALAVSQVNACRYCLSLHTYMGMNFANLSPEEIRLNRLGRSEDAKAEAALQFARKVIEGRGMLADADIAIVRSAGYGAAEIVEIVALCARYMMINVLNNVLDTDVDFPRVDPILAEATD
jgi:uncharacterized peroxidase-related enzyme